MLPHQPVSVSTLNFLRISQFTDRQDLHEAAEKTLRSFGPQMNNTPGAFPQMLTALNSALSKHLQIIIAGDPSSPETFAMLKEVHKRFLYETPRIDRANPSRDMLLDAFFLTIYCIT